MSKFFLSILAVAVATLSAAAQTVPTSIVEHIEAEGNIRIFQPAALLPLLEDVKAPEAAADTENGTSRHKTTSSQHGTRWGYRVQIFDDNNPRTARHEAERRHALVAQDFPQMKSYVTFNSPYWRVKVGDFRSRSEAEAAMAELRHAFPSMAAYMRIVRDKINIFD